MGAVQQPACPQGAIDSSVGFVFIGFDSQISYFCALMIQSVSVKSAFFHRFQNSVEGEPLPTRFTFPFYYHPHPLCFRAAKEVQDCLEDSNLSHNFGLADSEKSGIGKMFGVLVVENERGEIGYLKAFSGHLDTAYQGFVPLVYQPPKGENFYTVGLKVIERFTAQIKAIEYASEWASAKRRLSETTHQAKTEISTLREENRLAKVDRKNLRTRGQKSMSDVDFNILKARLANESREQKFAMKSLISHWKAKVGDARHILARYENQCADLVEKRANLSAGLQTQIFENYRFLNLSGKWKSLIEIFGTDTPPSGAGDCAAPKLLQYAFTHGLKPIAMAEFWWGSSPKTTIRQHKKFYPACARKCKPILTHMLEGMDVDANPLLVEHSQDREIQTIYDDQYIAVLNKPYGLLSTPGKEISDSVLSRMRLKYPDATGPLLVHRLDMDTSGLILIAKSTETYKNIQAQFLKRTIKKGYVALLESECRQKEGIIELPLRVDVDDRPNQMVCFEHGKPAITRFKVVHIKDGKTRINFYPITGRTHQLRMHAAHPFGLNCPIVGDILYGQNSDRMYLHAETLEFEHPVLKTPMKMHAKAAF